MSRPFLVFSCLLMAAVAGCGGDNQPRAEKPQTPVALKVRSPADMATVQAETVVVKGTVDPAGASVLVVGQKAPVSGGGTFTATVALEPGANVIDVMATASGRGPALTALRVTREVPVSVPDLGGKSEDEVNETLSGLGLKAEIEKGGGLIEDLLPGDPAVCEQDPDPGAQVKRGSKVRVVVSKSC